MWPGAEAPRHGRRTRRSSGSVRGRTVPSAGNASTGRCDADRTPVRGGYAASLEPSRHLWRSPLSMTDDAKAWFFKAQIARIRRLLLTTVNDEQTERALKQLAEEYEARANQEERRRAKED